jgi:hypothetical protein
VRGNFHASAALPSGKNCSRHPLSSGLSVSRGLCGCFRDVAGLLLLLSEIRRTLGRADYSLVSIPTVKSQTNLQNKLEWFQCHTEFQDLRDTFTSEVRMAHCYYSYEPITTFRSKTDRIYDTGPIRL